MIEKILGGLYGQALGDAFAMPALRTPEETWRHFGGYITEFLPGPEEHPAHRGLPAARVTDDTEQAFAIAEAIIAEGAVTTAGTAAAITAWYDAIDGDHSPVVGPSTRRAVQAIKRGEDLNTTGRFGDTNGAAMRIAPVGLIHPGDVASTVHDCYLSCIPTHHTDVAVSGAGAVAGASAAAMIDGATLDDLVEAGRCAAQMGRRLGNRSMCPSVPRRIELAVEIARSQRPERERLQELFDVVGATLAMAESVPAAFGVLIIGGDDPKRTAMCAAALSGDADTIGAMACAIAGTWTGIGGFDPALIRALDDTNPELDFARVARGLAKLAQGPVAK